MTGRQKILVVDDNAAYRQLMTIGLTRAGYDVMIANDGQQALNWLKNPQQRPDLILVDLLMPRMSGIEVLESIKTLPYKLPVILISGAEWPIARQGANVASPDAFLMKPFAMNELLEKIESLLSSASQEDPV